ncbi:rhomboid family intramembrane serine protease [Polaribacter sp.]|nr:rhomboid family intramembrane serine protease [Polaribacter sp.]
MTELVKKLLGKVFDNFIVMKSEQEFKFKNTVFSIPLFFLITIWVVYIVEILCNFNFNKFGVYPRSISGLKGIFFTHFIHSDTNHLLSNSIPLFVLMSALFYFYKKVAFRVLILGGLLTGLLTWCIARESYHIGASGLIYLLFSFQLFSGIIRRHFRLIALSFGIIFLYGSMIWYVLPIKEGMSWEGHLSGFLVGIWLAFIFKKKGIVKKEYQFKKTEFDLLFDEDGNFNPLKKEEEEQMEEENKRLF